MLVVTSDSQGFGKLAAFVQALPDQIVEVGIAEQTLVVPRRAWFPPEKGVWGFACLFFNGPVPWNKLKMI